MTHLLEMDAGEPLDKILECPLCHRIGYRNLNALLGCELLRQCGYDSPLQF